MSSPEYMISAGEHIVLNGVDFLSGGYLTPQMTAQDFVDLARAEYDGSTKAQRATIAALNEKSSKPQMGFDASLGDPTEARWGIIFAEDEDAQIKDAVEPLIRHRAAKLGFTPPIFEYQPGLTYLDFLAMHRVAPGFGEVAKIPYYLLLVGDPRRVPFRFQYELGSEYAVGRLAFDDASGYRAYVERLIDYESSQAVPTQKKAMFWGTSNANDSATRLTAQYLVEPLYNELDAALGFSKSLVLADKATKQSLTEAFSQEQPPALIFTASHGLGFSKPDERQPELQGALVTQEWLPDTDIESTQIFGGRDICGSDKVNVQGLVHFAFACYGAGTPRHDDFSHSNSAFAPIITSYPFIANLPQEELKHGAIAFIGHIERAWGFSFFGPDNQPMLAGFRRALKQLLRGIPVGHVLRDQHDHAVQLSHSLLESLNEIDKGKQIPPLQIAQWWRERNDARAYAVVGDPAVRLRVQDISIKLPPRSHS